MFPVFVHQIPKNFKTSDLRKLFCDYDSVLDISIVSNYGFVNFGSASEALDAIEKLNGVRVHGGRLVVDASNELEEYVRSKKRREEGKESLRVYNIW